MSSQTFEDGAPASDDDPYSSSTSSTYHINRDEFPKPIPIIGPMLGYDDKFFAKITRLKIERASASLKRPLTSDEANAMAYYGAKQVSIVSYATPLGVAGGAWRCWDTRQKFRFPFYGPNMHTFNPAQFPNRMVLYQGALAPQIWHLFRALFYVGFGKFAAGMLLGSYAMSVAAVGEMGDSRLSALRDVFKHQVEEQIARKKAIESGVPQPANAPRGAYQRKDTQASRSLEEQTFDDASPSGGMYFDDVKEPEKPTVATDRSVAGQGQTRAQSRNGNWPQPPLQSQQSNDDEDSPFKIFDDASPTGGQGLNVSTPTLSAQTGSAWERIRSGQQVTAAPGRAEEPRQSRAVEERSESSWSQRRSIAQDSDSQNGGYTASSSKEARKYSREEAQKEFDAKVERERRGGDFASSSGDQKRW